MRLVISKQPFLRGKPFSCPAHYCVLYSAVLGGAGHCSTLQSCQASVEGCALCLSVRVCVCKVQGRGCDGELGALRIRQKDPRVGGQSSSSSLQTIESPSESNWAHSDIGPVDCTTKLSSHPAPSQLYICSPLPSPRPVCVPLMSHHALLIITHKHSQNATTTTLVYLCCFFRAQKTAAVYLGMRTMSDCALYYNTQRQSATHTHTHYHHHHSSSLLSFSQPNLLPLYTPSLGHLLPQRSCHCDAPH